MKGQIFKVFSGKYIVDYEHNQYTCMAKGTLKLNREGILVGDFVDFQDGVITKIYPRKNKIVRPSVANVDVVAIVVSPIPKPDYYLIDKVIINALMQGIEPIIIVNKKDIDNGLFTEIVCQYSKVVGKIISASVYDEESVQNIKDELKGKTCVFAGQSAVGKTSLVNVLFGKSLKTGDVSEKILRGKHTTTASEIHRYGEIMVIDSPGFAMIEPEVKSDELQQYYPDFFEYENGCRFRQCAHISEPDCIVKEMVEKGEISLERYNRYVIMYNELKQKEKYDEKN